MAEQFEVLGFFRNVVRHYLVLPGIGLSFVMPGLVPGIHAFACIKQDVDGRDKPGHDGSV